MNAPPTAVLVVEVISARILAPLERLVAASKRIAAGRRAERVSAGGR